MGPLGKKEQLVVTKKIKVKPDGDKTMKGKTQKGGLATVKKGAKKAKGKEAGLVKKKGKASKAKGSDMDSSLSDPSKGQGAEKKDKTERKGGDKTDKGGDKTTQKKKSGTKLENQEWYFGAWPRVKVEGRLKKEGNFLCRLTTDSEGEDRLIVSVMGEEKVVHSPVRVSDVKGKRRYAFDGRAFDSVHALVATYIADKIPINKGTKILLSRGVRRPEFLLRHKDVEEKELVGPAGYGGTSELFRGHLARVEGKGAKVLKVLLKKGSGEADDEERGLMVEEAKNLWELHNPKPSDLAVRFHGLCSDRLPIILVLEDWGAPLSAHLTENKTSLAEANKLQLIVQLGHVLSFLEGKNMVHRNLRASSLLVEKGKLRLTGLCWAVAGPSWKAAEGKDGPGYPPGSARWMAPEVIKDQAFSFASDVWAAGVVAWELWYPGETPWAGVGEAEVEDKVRSGAQMPTMAEAPKLSALLLKTWEPSIISRPTPSQFLNDAKALFEGTQGAGNNLYLQMGELDQI